MEDKATNPESVNADANNAKPDSSQDMIPKSILQDVIKQRDELKEWRRQQEEIKAAEARKKLEEEGNYKAVIEQTAKELEDSRKELEESRKVIQTIRSDLISKLSEEDKEIAASLDLDKLRKFVDRITKQSPAMDTGRPGGNQTIDITGKVWNDFTIAQLNEINKANPEAYKRLKQTAKF